MIVRSALNEDKNAILALWHDCFQDPYEYIYFYLENRFDPETCVLLEDENEIIGMVHLLRCAIYPNQKAFYWYAAGIHSKRRKEGLFRKFTEYLVLETKKRGFCNICVPAPGLENFYRSIGFENQYSVSDEVFFRTKESRISSDEVTSSFFLPAAPNSFLGNFGKGDAVWDEAAIRYAIDENLYCEGKALKCKIDKNEFSFFAIKKEDGFLIDYHNLPKKAFLEIKDALFDELTCDRLIFRTVGNQKILGLSDSNLVDRESKISFTLA